MKDGAAVRGADLVAAALENVGVKYIFTVSGNHVMPLFDALLATNIKLIHARHEAACVHMADAWGRLTGEAGVALVTGGQGHSNAVAALYMALASESPVVLLSGHAGLNELGRGAFQEMPQADLARPVAKASWTSRSAASLGTDISKAFSLAKSGRSGPVHVSLPVDLLEQTIPDAAPPPVTPAASAPPDAGAVGEVLAQIKAASKPLMLCGPMFCTERGRAMMAKASDALGVPVIGMESPRGINDPALGAFAEVLAQADLIVLIGKPLDFTLKFGEAPAVSSTCKWGVIDSDKTLIARAAKALGERLAMSCVADAAPVLAALIKSSEGKRAATGWLQDVGSLLQFQPPQWTSLRSAGRDHIHPVEMCRTIGAFLQGHPGATYICDGGEVGQWAQALIHRDRRLINGIAGTIGASLPFAIAAKCHRPEHPVVAVMGDGTFGFHMAEFDTAVRYGIPFIAVVGNDARWNAEYQIQLRQYGADRARNCELLPARYDRAVEALGGFGACVSSADELGDALTQAHSSGKPACINVMMESVAAPIIRR
ncbi:MAG: thiamine pyrophosphate-binding protein [Bradyrhizobiaceae bacterium]|nr:MAG: thiamine pyrophosphate-binding protein [Bradyrhizobiaceae bacterium]